jgi:hypothetical protein
MRARRVAWLIGTAVLAGCTGRSEMLASRYVKKQVIPASAGGTLTVSTSDSQMLAGLQIVVPPGALAADTELTVAYGTASPAGSASAGPSVDLGPDGTRFQVPATITVPFALPAGATQRQLVVDAIESNRQTYRIANSALTVSGSFVSFGVNGFTQFQPGLGDDIPPPPDDGGCAAGESACVLDAGADGGCPPGYTCAFDDGGTPLLCVDTATDKLNCGGCGVICPPDQICSAASPGLPGSCSCDLSEPGGADLILCGSSCVHSNGDFLNCGGCGMPCVGGVCIGGSCVDAGASSCASAEMMDVYTAGPLQLDVLFVIDTSAAGSGENSLLAPYMSAFVTSAESIGWDFHFAVTTTDVCGGTSSEDGRLLPCPGCKVDGGSAVIITSSDPNAGQDLSSLMLGIDASTDGCGANSPQFFEAAAEALSPNLAYNSGFFRANAAHIVFLASGDFNDDDSPNSVASYVSGFNAMVVTSSGGEAQFDVDYMSPNGLGVDAGQPNFSWAELPPRLNSMMVSLGFEALDSEYPQWMQGLGDLLNVALFDDLPLTGMPLAGSINVYLDGPPPDRVLPGQDAGVLLSEGYTPNGLLWNYNTPTNTVVLLRLRGDSALTSSDTVYIEYSVDCPSPSVCGVLGGASATQCLQTCDPYLQNCPTTINGSVQGCYYEQGVDALVCELANANGVESLGCTYDTDCGVGLDCFLLTADELDAGLVQACRSFCDSFNGGGHPCPGVDRQCVGDALLLSTANDGGVIAVGACQP